MSEDNICGEETSKGTPCKNPADSCPWDHENGNDTGRTSLFNEETKNACLEAARKGKSQAGCARAAGVDEKTLRGWLNEYEQFSRAFARARAEGEDKLIDGGMHNPDVDSSFAKFLLASSFGYVKTEKREIEQETTHKSEGFDIPPKFLQQDEQDESE